MAESESEGVRVRRESRGDLTMYVEEMDMSPLAQKASGRIREKRTSHLQFSVLVRSAV